MKNTALFSMLIVAIIVMAGAFVYFQVQKTSGYPDYHVNMYLNATNLTTYYPIHVNSNLTGNGTYQQLLTFSDPSHYGINANGSNLAFYDGSNNTHLYAWIQSMNNTSMQVWVKNYYGNSVIGMQVLPSFENLFSANGYLGYGREYFNAPYVFQFASDMTSSAGFTFNGGSGETYTFNSTGLYMTGSGTNGGNGLFISNNTYTNAYVIANFTTIPTTATDSNFRLFLQVYSSGIATDQYGYGASEYTVMNMSGFLSVSGSLLDSFGSLLSQSGYQTGYLSISINGESYTVADEPIGGSFSSTKTGMPSSGQIAIGSESNYTVRYNYILIATSVSMPTFTIGAFTNMTDHVDVSYLSNSITIPMPNWFNLTLMAYTNYSFTFQYNNTPLYFTYDGLINNTIYTGFFDHNLTLDIHFIALGYSGKTELIVGEKT